MLHKDTKGIIKINIDTEGNYFIIEIDDNGIGRRKASELKTKTATSRKSYGMKITEDRIRLINQINDQSGTVQTIDKVDEYGNPSGTKVILKLRKTQKSS